MGSFINLTVLDFNNNSIYAESDLQLFNFFRGEGGGLWALFGNWFKGFKIKLIRFNQNYSLKIH